ncbi:MAG: DUF2946 family protein [Alcaligenaceae bacterium]|nr:DUF2946 family protein [Alcaligenaceae bacterium]
MDEKVIAAMARWPGVPAVFGWLSLNERGQWRLHPAGDALADEATADPCARQGTSITSPQILRFMNRNYACDDAGRWYFQNGPQKVYVRLDAAPYVLSTGNPCHGGPSLHTHTGLQVGRVASWWATDTGRLYAQTDLGPGLVAGRDLDAVFDALRSPDGRSLLDILDGLSPEAAPVMLEGPASDACPLHLCSEADIPSRLGFVRFPRAD